MPCVTCYIMASRKLCHFPDQTQFQMVQQTGYRYQMQKESNVTSHITCAHIQRHRFSLQVDPNEAVCYYDRPCVGLNVILDGPRNRLSILKLPIKYIIIKE